MNHRTNALRCALALSTSVYACSETSNGRDPEPPGPVTEQLPRAVEMVASGEFEVPTDAVSSPDGSIFYFAAHQTIEEESQAAIFSVRSDGGPVTVLHTGAPFGNPTGLVLSCDGETLFVADQQLESAEDDGEESEDRGAILTIATSQGPPTELSTRGISTPAGLALSTDCATLYATGQNDEGQPALFSVPTEGGIVTTILAGDPLVSPTGMHVDKDGVAWVLDHLAVGDRGAGVLFAISSDGRHQIVASGLLMGTPGGVSLSSTGGMAYVPTTDSDGNGQLTGINLTTMAVTLIPASTVSDPAGLRTARNASVFALVDSQGGAIFSAR